MAKAPVAALMLLAGLGLEAGCSSGDGPVHLSVDLVLEHCPLVTSWKASPLQVSAPNGTIDVSVTAREDIDAGANPLQYMWSASAGTFSDSTAPTSIYTCSTAGAQLLRASVTDNHRRVPCADVISIQVTCKE